MADGMHDWVLSSALMAKALADKGYHYQYVFARNSKHVDRPTVAQTFPAARPAGTAATRTKQFPRGATRPGYRRPVHRASFTWQTDRWSVAVFDTIIRPPSNPFRQLRMRGHRGMALECALAVLLIAFAAVQVLFVASVGGP